MTDVNIDEALKPLQKMITTLEGSAAARAKYGNELDAKIREVETAIGLLTDITTGVNKLKDDIKNGQDAISAAKVEGDQRVVAEIERVKKEAKETAVAAAKEAGENVTAAKREAIDKIQPLVDAIAAQKENIEGAIDDLNNVGFSDSMDKVVKAINELNKIFNTDGPKPPPQAPKAFGFGDAGLAMTTKKGQDALRKQRFEDAKSQFQGGRRRTRKRRRGGFRYGVPKSALPRTLRSMLSLKTKSTRRKSPKRRKRSKGKKSRRRRKRRR